MFETNHRDGLGRVGTWSLSSATLTTPNLIFITSERFHPFPEAEILLTDHAIQTDKPYIMDLGSKFIKQLEESSSRTTTEPELCIPADLGYPLSCNELLDDAAEHEEDSEVCVIHNYDAMNLADKINLNADLYVLGNSIELVRNPRTLALAVTKIKTAIGYHKPLYAPAIGLPNQLAFMAYCGIDMFDTIQLILSARDGWFLRNDGKISKDVISDNAQLCYCPACKAAAANEKDRFAFECVLQHNYYAALTELAIVRNAIINGKLRELVEQRALSEPWLCAGLKILDLEFYDFQEPYLPIMRRSKLMASSSDSINRPEVRRFRTRLKNHYNKPPSPKLLLLLPCSARKPYSSSRSHKLFRRALLGSNNPNVIHEVILTSPLGIVPRELELFYPAQQYDIPVTGVWDPAERAMIVQDLTWFVKHNQYETTLVHLDGELLEIVDDVFQKLEIKPIKTCNGSHPTSQAALTNLKDTISELAQKYEKVSAHAHLKEGMVNLLKFQFGELGTKFVEGGNIKIKGRYPHLKLLREHAQLGMVTAERGMVSLTFDGAKILTENKAYWVEIDDFMPKGSVMAVGVTDADTAIRIEDEVAIIHQGELRGVGKAVMSVPEMLKSNRGVAVKVRHHI